MKPGRVSLLVPALLLAVGVWVPLAYIVQLSVGGKSGVHRYGALVTDAAVRRVLLNTFVISVVVVLVTLVIGYGISIVFLQAGSWVRRLLLVAVVVPFFTSVLIKSFSFIILLGPHGLIADLTVLFGLGRVSPLYSWTAVVIGMSYSLLPYMVLTLVAAMSSIDERLILAAQSLGASGWQRFRRITVPLTRGAILGGSLLVFVLSFGYYVTPQLLGGPGDSMVATSVATDALTALNFGEASALAVAILVVVSAVFILYLRLFGVSAFLNRADGI